MRSLSAASGVALALLLFGAPVPTGPGTRGATPSAAGSVGPGLLDARGDASAAAGDGPGTAAGPLTVDRRALVSFTRTTVQTRSKTGKGELRAASAGLTRPGKGFLMAPLETLNQSSHFGLRTSPLTGVAGEFHWGQDFAAPCGTRVYSADAGVVRAVGWHPWGGGNRVEIDHGNGLITTYNHLQGIAVHKGESVGVDEVIALVGTTGSSTGCHLHFETILNGAHVNPLEWKFLPTRQVDRLDAIGMTSYAPGAAKVRGGGSGSPDADWAIPVAADHTHVVAGGIQEKPVAHAGGARTAPSPTKTPEAASTPTATPTPTPTATPTPSPTPTPTAGVPTAPSPTPTPTANVPTAPGPTPTPTPTPTQPAAQPSPDPSLVPAPAPVVTDPASAPVVTDPASATGPSATVAPPPPAPAPAVTAAPAESTATKPSPTLEPLATPTP